MKKSLVRALIVDDEPAARTALKQLLKAEGYEVDEAEHGAEALQRIGEVPPDVLITDLHMPVMAGMQLIEELRRRGHDLPIIVLTSAAELRSAVDAMRAGASDYVTKPADFDALLLSVQRAVEHHAVRIENENLRRQIREQHGEGLQGLLGASPAMQSIRTLQYRLHEYGIAKDRGQSKARSSGDE